MIKRSAAFFFNLLRCCLTVLLLETVDVMYAQSSTVSFAVDGSLHVANEVVYLQTTALLNLNELYSLSSNPSGILMQVSPEYGSNGRVEVRVFAYDHKNKAKGALIYASTGTKSGWNEDYGLITGSLFKDEAHFSEKIEELFGAPYKSKYSSTNIKQLSQFENMGFVCNDPAGSFAFGGRYIDVALGNISVPVARFSSNIATRVTRDDDDFPDDIEEKECKDYDKAAEEKEEKADKSKQVVEEKTKALNEAEAAVKEAEMRAKDATQKLIEAAQKASVTRLAADAARDEASTTLYKLGDAQTALNTARDVATDAALTLAAAQNEAKTALDNLTKAQTDLDLAKEVERQAADYFLLNPHNESAAQAFRDAQAAVEAARKIRDEARSRSVIADDTEERAGVAFDDAELKLEAARDEEATARADYQAAYSKYNAAKSQAYVAAEAAQHAGEASDAAKKALEEAKARNAKALAELVDAFHQAEDDEDDAAAAAAAVQVAEYVGDDDSDSNYPNALMAILEIFGYSYLEDEFFHHPSLSQEGIEGFRESYKQCAARTTGDWCGLYSPMPPVLIEVAIKNASLIDLNIQGVRLPKPSGFLLRSPQYANDKTARYVAVTETGQSVVDGYPIVKAPFATEVNLPDFSKTDHIKVPDFVDANAVVVELKMDSQGRLLLAATEMSFKSLEEELDKVANDTGVKPEEYYSLQRISHSFMAVDRTLHGTTREAQNMEILTYELRSLVINKQFGNSIAARVTPEGPFEVSHGSNPEALPQPSLNNKEILSRASVGEDLYKSEGELLESGSIKIYPNPTQGVVNIQFTLKKTSPVQLRFYDIFGNTIYEKSEGALESGTYLRVIDVKRKRDIGMYFISISTAQNTQTAKVLIE
ncbi:MAG: T9SS type A sorting domain-containing protein [Bacteroidota bacterium]